MLNDATQIFDDQANEGAAASDLKETESGAESDNSSIGRSFF